MVIRTLETLDKEWVELILAARELKLHPEDIRQFLKETIVTDENLSKQK